MEQYVLMNSVAKWVHDGEEILLCFERISTLRSKVRVAVTFKRTDIIRDALDLQVQSDSDPEAFSAYLLSFTYLGSDVNTL